jgi:cell division protease FtsH
MQATSVARRMVTQYGMSEAVGPICLAEQHAGADTERVVDAEVSRMLRESEQRVRAMLKELRPELDAVAKALLDNELLTANESAPCFQLKSGEGPARLGPAAGAACPPLLPASAVPEVATAGGAACRAAARRKLTAALTCASAPSSDCTQCPPV